MMGWNHTTAKRSNEVLKTCRNEVDVNSELCEGEIQLEITPFESFSQINKYKKYLATIDGLRIVEENWSEDKGYNIVVSVRVPLALGRLLQNMPEVARVQLNGNKYGYFGHKHGFKKMVVVMKTAEATPEPVLA
jgi:hypothetical protein